LHTEVSAWYTDSKLF